MSRHSSIVLAVSLILCGFSALLPPRAPAQIAYEDEPISYMNGSLQNPVADLQQKLASGSTHLERDPRVGYLASLLRTLGVEVESQMLVFSKTSFQLRLISPSSPRAVYFNDDTYVGYVPGGEVLEISVADPQRGAVFFSLDQSSGKITRHTHECLQCHASSVTQNVPGHVVRSVFPDREGHPVLRAGSFVTTPESPFSERWGGWYVTGTHGQQRHMGNVTIDRGGDESSLDRNAGANLTDLSKRLELKNYLAAHSDLVALMVLEHQTHVHNLITAANYQAQRALYDEDVMNKMLGRTGPEHSPSTLRRIANSAEKLVEGLLLCRETALESPVRGTSGFAANFAGRGPRDTRGRSLRELDLQRRLFRYPCSYLVYSQSFLGLPPVMKERVLGRIKDIVNSPAATDAFAHLSADDRAAIREILTDTHPEFATAVASPKG